jgi:tetratricopeptide (TPR) repeat protein
MIRLKQYQSPDTAIPDLRRAAELLPDHAGTHYLLGSAYADDHALGEATMSLRRAVELNPTHYRAWYRLGEVLEESGQILEAIEAYSASIRSNPMFPNAYNKLGNIYVRYEHLAEAIAVFEEGFDHAADATNVNALGSALLAAGRVPEAIEALQRAIELDPSSVEYNYNLSVAYAEAYELSMTEPDKERALSALRMALDNCGALDSQARCNAIRNYIEEIENPEGLVEPQNQN